MFVSCGNGNDKTIISWIKTFGDEYTNAGYSVQQTSDGAYIVAGSTHRNNTDVYLIKTDAKGNIQ
jgi:hypothetical protein